MAPILHLLTRALAATPKSVFAHVVVGNTAAHNVATWTQDINLAAQSGIDAFVLNMGYPDPNIPQQIANAFTAAESYNNSNFKLFFAFDYLGGGQPWPATGVNSVSSYLNQYKNSPAYFKYQNKPFVSTFEGVSNTQDWAYGGPIRSSVGPLYFVPDWCSLGPAGITAHLDKIEGAFSWDMWPTGTADMSIATDQAWQNALAGKSYMMGVSPWFFRSAQGGKNWLWNGGDLWDQRWRQTVAVAPQFVQIVTWNDYGESHYIGPIPDPSEIPTGSHDYVTSNPHDSWRSLLPYYIALYKGTRFNLVRDQMQYWYRPSLASGGSPGNVVANNANQGQTELPPASVSQDKVFYTALLKADADVYVSIGNNRPVLQKGRKGLNHWNVPLNGQTGTPMLTIVRQGRKVQQSSGTQAITPSTSMANGMTNWNAWVGNF